MEPGVGLSNWVDHVKTWQLIVPTIVDYGGQRSPKEDHMPNSTTGLDRQNLHGRMSYP
jgi:hypothetical protein